MVKGTEKEMIAEFIKCNKRLTNESIKELTEQCGTNYLYLLIERTERLRNPKTYEWENKITRRINTVIYHPNVIILGHDIFYEFTVPDDRIIGYCPIVFDEEYKDIINI